MDDTQRAGMPSPAGLSNRAHVTAARAEPGEGSRAGDAGDEQHGDESHAAGAGGLTGDAAVDEALRALDGLADVPLPGHVAAFDAVHGALQDRLAEAQG